MVSNGHSALLSGREYDAGLMQKAQGQLTQGQGGKLWRLKQQIWSPVAADTRFTTQS